MSTASLVWVNPTTRTDGTALDPSAIASVDVFDSVDGAAPVNIANLPGAATTFTTGVLTVGNHTFTVDVNDTSGHVSAQSAGVLATVVAVLASPSAPTGLTVTLNP